MYASIHFRVIGELKLIPTDFAKQEGKYSRYGSFGIVEVRACVGSISAGNIKYSNVTLSAPYSRKLLEMTVIGPM